MMREVSHVCRQVNFVSGSSRPKTNSHSIFHESGSVRPESFRPESFRPGSFRPGSFRPILGVGRFGLGRWVLSAKI